MPKIPQQGLTGDVLMREAVTEFRAIIDLLRSTLAARFHPTEPGRWVNLQAVYGDSVVVNTDKGHLYKFPYTIDSNNEVKLGEPTEVKTDYVALKEALVTNKPTGDQVFIEAKGDAKGGKWLIRVIKSGLSLNNYYYPDAVLREAAPLFNGARVFIKSDDDHIKGKGKSVKNLIAGLSNATFNEGASADTGDITATLTFIEADGVESKKVTAAFEAGMNNLFGFSIDAQGSGKKITKNRVRMIEATKIKQVDSVDLIVEPGAGGQLIRMVESNNSQQTNQEIDPMRVRMIEAIKAANPAAAALITDDTSDEAVEAAYREAIAKPAPTKTTDTSDVEERVRMIEARAEARATINACTLKPAAKDKLIADFNMRESFKAEDVTAAIESEREYLGKFTESGKPNLAFDEGARVEDKSAATADMLDAFFDPSHKDHRKFGSFKEAYIAMTGDRGVTGQMKNADQALMREAFGINMREALTSASWSDALGDAITRRMQAIYTGMVDLQAWRKVCRIGRASDFRTMERIRIGGYGNLPIVAEDGPYTALTSPTDTKATYAVAKRGGTERVTMEMIKNDDVGAIMQIPQELALAAGNTLYEFVFNFFSANAAIYDTKALYHADHNNLFTAAFSATEYAKHRLAMLKQTRAGSAKRLATAPKFLLLPFELEEAGYNAFVRNQNHDADFVQSNQPEIISVSHWTDANDWVTLADPARMPALEVSFLDGQEEPELFVQDQPTNGSMFSNDQLTYKIRHIYGGGILVDGEKATTKAVVA